MTEHNYRCENCGDHFEKAPDEVMGGPNVCGPCARHYIGLVEKAMGKRIARM